MRVVIGSTRAPKVEGARHAFDLLAHLPWPGVPVEIIPLDVASGQADTPLGDAATIEGARARARSALDQLPGVALALGMEGGAIVMSERPLQVLLRNWVVAWNGTREGLGAGPSLQLPETVARALSAGEDLANVIDRYAEEHNVRSRQGAFGVLTRGLIPRADAYSLAVLAALAPFYNHGWEA